MYLKKSTLAVFILFIGELCAGTPTSNAGTDVPSYGEVEEQHIKRQFSAFVTVEVTLPKTSYEKKHHWIKVIDVHAAGPLAPIERLTKSPPRPRIHFASKALCTKTFIEDLASKGWESSSFMKEVLKKGSYRTLILITYNPTKDHFEPYYYNGNNNYCLDYMLNYRDKRETLIEGYTKSFVKYHGPDAAK